MSLGFFNLDADVQKIVDAHKNDFNYDTADSYLKKVGGYKAYVKSLGGVFAKYADFSGKITSISQLYDICNYVWGLYMIWGVDYSNGCSWTWDENMWKAYLSGADRYYPRREPKHRFDVNYALPGFGNGSDLPGIDEMLGGNYYKVTNCGQGVAQVLKKAGLIPRSMSDPAYHAGTYRSKGYGYKLIKSAKDLQPGDVLLFTQGGSIPNRSSRSTLDNWTSHIAHTAIVGKRDSQYIYMFDSGHAFTYEGRPINRRQIGDNNVYQWQSDWIGIRLDCIAKLSGAQNGWIQKNGKWYYYEAGKLIKGWKKILYQGVKRWFFLNDDGTMATGWKKIFWNGANRWFFFGSDGAMRTGWQEITYRGTKKWFFFDDNGVMLTGLHELSWKGKKAVYYFDPESGVMQTGKVKLKVTFNASGQLTGGVKV